MALNVPYMPMSVQCLSSGNSESSVYSVSGKRRESSEIREYYASNVDSVNCVNSVKSLLRGATPSLIVCLASSVFSTAGALVVITV